MDPLAFLHIFIWALIKPQRLGVMLLQQRDVASSKQDIQGRQVFQFFSCLGWVNTLRSAGKLKVRYSLVVSGTSEICR
jgi:hypothetical protein